MGVPTSEVGYTIAMPRREDHEVHKDMWKNKKKKLVAKLNKCCSYDINVKNKINMKHSTDILLKI
jgi:hypothetical protein